MGRKIFVGGLPWATDDTGLKEAFEGFGEITYTKVITDRDTGQSRGFGFVEFATEEAAQNAISNMDGGNIGGRTVRVNEAHERKGGGSRPPRRDSGRDSGRGYHGGGNSGGGGDTAHWAKDDGRGGDKPPRRPRKRRAWDNNDRDGWRD